MGRSPWDEPWGHPGRHGRSGGRGSSWSGGPPPWLEGLIGLAKSGQGFPGMAPRGAKVRRGDVRAAILDVLSVEPMNGYQIIQQIAERSGGAWKPSPGSVYPTVQQLEDEGLIEGRQEGGRRLLQLTEDGRKYVDEHPDEMAETWRVFDEPESVSDDDGPDLKPVIGQVMGAVWQVIVSGTRQQQAEAAEILAETRRKLYGLLAEGDGQ